jgi:LytR cell envelope-related transcriptional attenuator
VEHAHRIDRSFSWRGAALALGLLFVIAFAVLGGWALLDRPGGANGPVAPAAPRPRSATSVLVLNGNGIAGAAGGLAHRLLADGYRSAVATNAQVTTYARSLILYRPGWQSEAERLARTTHIHAVAPLDGPVPATDASSPLVVILGR